MIVPGNDAAGGEKVGGGSVRGTLACFRVARCCAAVLLCMHGESRNVTQYSKRENVK
jgi:hypothetical protein